MNFVTWVYKYSTKLITTDAKNPNALEIINKLVKRVEDIDAEVIQITTLSQNILNNVMINKQIRNQKNKINATLY